VPSGYPDGVLLHAKIGQDLGVSSCTASRLWHAEQSFGDRLTVGAGVRTVVAAEASREIVVAELFGWTPPSHLHFREDIAQINVGNGIGRFPVIRTSAMTMSIF
jgi:hypothetical protein